MNRLLTLMPLLTLDTDPIESLSYCLDFQPGEDIFLDSLVNEHGDYLEKLTKREKLFLVSAIANSISSEDPGVVSNEIHELATKCYDNMSLSDLLGLMGALTEQIRWGHYAETTTEQTLQHTGSIRTHENP
jgi:hypothetical protein